MCSAGGVGHQLRLDVLHALGRLGIAEEGQSVAVHVQADDIRDAQRGAERCCFISDLTRVVVTRASICASAASSGS
jgi:hypothetical protein